MQTCRAYYSTDYHTNRTYGASIIYSTDGCFEVARYAFSSPLLTYHFSRITTCLVNSATTCTKGIKALCTIIAYISLRTKVKYIVVLRTIVYWFFYYEILNWFVILYTRIKNREYLNNNIHLCHTMLFFIIGRNFSQIGRILLS